MKAYYIRYIDSDREYYEIVEAENAQSAIDILNQCEPIPAKPLEIIVVWEYDTMAEAQKVATIETFSVTSKAPRITKDYDFNSIKEALVFWEKKNSGKTKYGYRIVCRNKNGWPVKTINY